MISNSNARNRLLLVDDEPDITNILKIGLENSGYIVDVYDNPSEALENFKPKYYHRIITDIRMPSMSGFELARRIWGIDRNANICFLSAFDIHESEARKVFASHKDHCFITKPVTPSQLAMHIQEHANTSQAVI